MKTLLATILILRGCLCQIHFPLDTMPETNFVPKPYDSMIKTMDESIAGGISKLTLAIGRAISKTKFADDDKVVYSPVNIAGVLALILMGSNGKTFHEISEILSLGAGIDVDRNSLLVHQQFGRFLDKIGASGNDFGEEVKMAAAIFVQNNFPIRPVYKRTAEELYNNEVFNLDFENAPDNAMEVINAWVKDKTNGKISSILKETPNTMTKIMIASALYFKALWEQPFFEGMTSRRPFFTNGRKAKPTKMTDMMANGGLFPFFHDNILDCNIMGFPYKGNKTTMYVMMPNGSNKEKLKLLQQKLTLSDLDRIVENMRYRQSNIIFPKMKLDSSLDLSGILMALGLKSLFNSAESNLALISPGPNLLANRNPLTASLIESDPGLIFSRSGVPANESDANSTEKPKSRKRRQQQETIDSLRASLGPNYNPGLYADTILHKVFMSITESGTEAAAATVASLTRGGDIIIFRVDVPFLFFIRNHDTKLILFWGAVYTPS